MSVFVFRYVYDDANAAMMDKLRPQPVSYTHLTLPTKA